MIPLILRLRRNVHKEIAQSQDLIVEELYSMFDNAVLHGGTAIWRCYKSNRFSEDIDVYTPRDTEKIELFFENLKKKGFNIIKKRVRQNTLFSVLQFNRTIVRFEAIFKSARGILKEYETADGNLITIYSLTPEQLIKEKVPTYLKRLKIRDLYDIFFLLRYVKDIQIIKNDLQYLIKNFKMPLDKNELKVLIMEGITPKIEYMLEYIKNKIQDGKRKISKRN